MQLNNLPQYYFSYKFATRPMAEGRDLPVSTAFDEEHNHWVTVPWDQIVTTPEDPVGPNPSLPPEGGTFWSFLNGPCIFNFTATVGTGEVTPLASVHLQPYATDTPDGPLTASWEGWEWGVLQKEGNTSHFTGAWWGHLAAGKGLRLRIDYWHAPHAAKINRAHVEGSYWRMPA
jgi:hypothetical protein